MRQILAAALLLAVVASAGCAKVVGPYYLESERYEEGIEVLSQEFRENPEDASSAFYVGRYYLALNKPKEALPYLRKAATLESENADYVFWTGVAYWALLDFEKERAAYEKTLALDPDHISANLYLGHGYVDEGEWEKALKLYDTVIRLDKYNPEALYYRAVSLSGLGRVEDEILAWKKFLKYYPSGRLGLQAVERLNLQGDFTYRNFILGQRNVTLRSMTFKKGSSDPDSVSRESLHVISAMMRTNSELTLHIVSYVEGDLAKAKARAFGVRDYILGGNPDIDADRLPLSWFGTAEKVELGGKNFSLDESVTFITAVQ